MSSTDPTTPDIGRIPQLGDPHPNALPPHFRAETARDFMAKMIGWSGGEDGDHYTATFIDSDFAELPKDHTEKTVWVKRYGSWMCVNNGSDKAKDATHYKSLVSYPSALAREAIEATDALIAALTTPKEPHQ